MKTWLTGIVCSTALSLACVALAQNDPKPAPPPFPTPQKAPSPESPQNTTNATAEAESEYQKALAKCDMGPQNERAKCVNEAEEHFYGALSGSNPGLQGNPGSNTGATETGK